MGNIKINRTQIVQYLLVNKKASQSSVNKKGKPFIGIPN